MENVSIKLFMIYFHFYDLPGTLSIQIANACKTIEASTSKLREPVSQVQIRLQ